MQSSSEQPLVGEERYVTTRITAAKETMVRVTKAVLLLWRNRVKRTFCDAHHRGNATRHPAF